MASERIKSLQDESVFGKNLVKYHDMISYFRWYPDLMLDMLSPKKGGIKLHLDQRIFLRCYVRFFSLYGTFPRGYGKTYDEVLAAVCVCLLFPNISLAISAQTKETAVQLLSDKWGEISKHFPLLDGELLERPKFTHHYAGIVFKNDSCLDVLANTQSAKGNRRRRLTIEESALLNNGLFEDALHPVVEVPRLTVGKLGIVDPCELNQSVHFFTTAGFKGSDEYGRVMSMVEEMENLNGVIVLGSNWQLSCWYGRGSSKSQILQKKKNMSSIAFAMNYEQVWTGASDGALVNINKLMSARTLTSNSLKICPDDEFYMGVDVARSQKNANNQSSVVVGRVIRNSDRTRIVSVEIVDIVNVPNILNFKAQAVKIKQLQKKYNAKAVICDGNGLGAGLVDELLQESFDPITGESLGCWDTINDDNTPELADSPKILYNLKSQSWQSKIVTNFIDFVDSGKLRLLERRQENDFAEEEWDESDTKIRPFIETDAFIAEAANLKLKHLASGGVTIEKVIGRIDKDRVSALIYLLWYIEEFTKEITNASQYNYTTFIN